MRMLNPTAYTICKLTRSTHPTMFISSRVMMATHLHYPPLIHLLMSLPLHHNQVLPLSTNLSHLMHQMMTTIFPSISYHQPYPSLIMFLICNPSPNHNLTLTCSCQDDQPNLHHPRTTWQLESPNKWHWNTLFRNQRRVRNDKQWRRRKGGDTQRRCTS